MCKINDEVYGQQILVQIQVNVIIFISSKKTVQNLLHIRKLMKHFATKLNEILFYCYYYYNYNYYIIIILYHSVPSL